MQAELDKTSRIPLMVSIYSNTFRFIHRFTEKLEHLFLSSMNSAFVRGPETRTRTVSVDSELDCDHLLDNLTSMTPACGHTYQVSNVVVKQSSTNFVSFSFL